MPNELWLNSQAALKLELTSLGLEAERLSRVDGMVSKFWQHCDPQALVQETAEIFDYKASLLRRLNVVLAVVKASLAVVEEDSESPSHSILVVLVTQNGTFGEILRCPSSSVLDLATTTALRSNLKSEDFSQQLQQLSSSIASCVMDLLLLELKFTASSLYRRICDRSLRYLSKAHGVLPPSFLIYDIERDGEFPVTCGGFADIYKGRLNSTPVCLKVLRYFSSATPMERKRLIKLCCREALAWKRLDHSNILPFIGIAANLFQPSFCLISPWMENGNIMFFLEKNPGYDRLKAITEIAQAIKYLHDYNPPVIHADIRGGNVLVTDDLRCCLTDFGLASVSETQFPSSTGTHGTLRWTAPEYLKPDVPQLSLLPPRDIYAFGCTILEIYTGKPPFHYHHNDGTVLFEVLKGRRPRKDNFEPDNLWPLIESCWQQDMHKRPSADDVLATLLSLAGPSNSLACDIPPSRTQNKHERPQDGQRDETEASFVRREPQDPPAAPLSQAMHLAQKNAKQQVKTSPSVPNANQHVHEKPVIKGSKPGVVSMEDVIRSRAVYAQPRVVPLSDGSEDDGADSDASTKAVKDFSSWAPSRGEITVQKPVIKRRLVGGGSHAVSDGRESSANAKFGSRLLSGESSNSVQPASRRSDGQKSSANAKFGSRLLSGESSNSVRRPAC